MISIRWRLTLLLGLVVGALVLATGAGVFLTMRNVLRAQFDETLTAKSEALITASEIDDGDFEIDLTVQDFAGFGTGGTDYFEIRRMNGEIFFQSPSLLSGGGAGKQLVPFDPPRNDDPAIHAVVLPDGRAARVYVQRFYPKGDKRKRFQDLYLIVASPTRGMQMQLTLLGTVLAGAGGIALLLMIPLIQLGLRSGLRPLHRLTSKIARIRPENLDARLDETRLPAELIPVAARLNEWIARLESSFERERRFSSHAAHELRTPLAEMKSMAELGARWPEEATTALCADMLSVANEMEVLVEKLALLARADAGRQPVNREPVDLEASVLTAVARAEKRAAERKVRITTRVTPGELATDPVLWGAILQNLISNAVDHAPEGAEVIVQATPQSLVVENPAPDLKPEDLDRIFEGFWRKNEARSGYGHSGLGLSIVKACASLLDGDCRAELVDGGRFQVAVKWAGPEAPTNHSAASQR